MGCVIMIMCHGGNLYLILKIIKSKNWCLKKFTITGRRVYKSYVGKSVKKDLKKFKSECYSQNFVNLKIGVEK